MNNILFLTVGSQQLAAETHLSIKLMNLICCTAPHPEPWVFPRVFVTLIESQQLLSTVVIFLGKSFAADAEREGGVNIHSRPRVCS